MRTRCRSRSGASAMRSGSACRARATACCRPNCAAASPDKVIIVASIAADWGASYLPPRELYDTGIYQESIAVVAAGSLEQLIESIAHDSDEN